MEKRYKDILRPLVAELRRTLAGTANGSTRGDLDRELERLGIAPDGAVAQTDVVANPTAAERRVRAVAAAELGAIADVKERIAARTAFVERAAYGWINRLLALRVLEARGLIDETLRSNPDYEGLSEALYVLRQSDPARTSGPDGGWWAVIEDACAVQAAALPGLFGLDSASGPSSAALYDPAIALRPSTTALLQCIELLGGAASAPRPQSPSYAMRPQSQADHDAAFADPDAIGWAYQFSQEEAKAQVYADLKRGKKVATRDEIAAATELFTEPYMVKWLLQNSLGRRYHEANPESALPSAWEYYIRPEQLDAPAFPTLESLTLLDPCMGSGHFLREAFDMLVAMYREQQPELDAPTIADRILAQHLHGIDIDPRAAQLAAFTLYARAWELVRDERRARRHPGPGSYTPAALNLATTPGRIPPGALARHLQRHPGDRPLEPLLKGVFDALENADILGSLLRPREHLAAAIAELRKPRQLQIQPDPDLQAVQEAIESVLQTDPARLEEMLLERVAASFAAEAGGTDDVAAALFGRAVERGVRLLQLLDRRYAVVVTNPPYMGSKNMDTLLRQYVERHYAPGKRDLYAAFVLRCLQLATSCGRVAMVTQHSWMFLGSFTDLRALSEEELSIAQQKGAFTGLLRETSLETLAHLGPNAFEEISGEVVQSTLVIAALRLPGPEHHVTALRLVGQRSAGEKALVLRQLITDAFRADGIAYHIQQLQFLNIAGYCIAYSAHPALLDILHGADKLVHLSPAYDGISTTDNHRFVRCRWEMGNLGAQYPPYAKGGDTRRWSGLELYCIDWRDDGRRLKEYIVSEKGHNHWSRQIRSSERQFTSSGLTYSLVGSGKLGIRLLGAGTGWDAASQTIVPDGDYRLGLLAYLNSRLASALARILSPDLKFRGGYISNLPIPPCSDLHRNEVLAALGECAAGLTSLKDRSDPIEQEYCVGHAVQQEELHRAIALRSAIEAEVESMSGTCLQLSHEDHLAALVEIGLPPGWQPLLEGYDAIPAIPGNVVAIPSYLFRQLAAHQRMQLPVHQITSLKTRLRAMYAGQRDESLLADTVEEDNGTSDEAVGELALPIGSETFLEELAAELQIHPISVYWLLQEIRAEGARSKPEEQRLLEDRLSVMVLRLLGHRWPKQIEAGEPVPGWADSDGIIPMLTGSGEAPLAERVRERLRDEDGDLGAQQTEALLTELTGRSLEEWLRRDFFPRHVRQFKYRPIAWHLASAPQAAGASGTKGRGKGGARQMPAFECLVYYHATGAGLLARIRTQYVEALLHAERGRETAARQAGDDTTAARANARVRELEAFTERLRRVEEQGFACAELNGVIAREPLDRWSGDGILPPSSNEALLAQEQAWMVDVNDGVRVNIAPMQLAGVLAADVLKDADARKAIADRARWRADERRWVREGVLPRCGWMAEDIPESPRWTERTPEREAERARLEAKRAEALRKLEGATG